MILLHFLVLIVLPASLCNGVQSNVRTDEYCAHYSFDHSNGQCLLNDKHFSITVNESGITTDSKCSWFVDPDYPGVDECKSDPCFNSGTCIDGFRSWSCNCPAGYYGTQCSSFCGDGVVDVINGEVCDNGTEHNQANLVLEAGYDGDNVFCNANCRTSTNNWKDGDYTVTDVYVGTAIWKMYADSSKIAVGCYDYTVKLYNRTTLVKIGSDFTGHTWHVGQVPFNDDILVSGSLDTTVKIWNVTTGQVIKTIFDPTNNVFDSKLDGSTLVTGSHDFKVRVYDVTDPVNPILQMVMDTGAAAYAVDLNDEFIAAAGVGGTIKVYDRTNGNLLATLTGIIHKLA